MTRRSIIMTELRTASLIGAGSAFLFVVALMVMACLAPQTQAPYDTTLRDISAKSIAARSSAASPSSVITICARRQRRVGFVKILGALFLNLPLLGNVDVWTQSACSFEKQLAYLAENGYESVGLDKLIAWQRGYGGLPPKPVVITFDDGDRSALEFARPILERYGFKATLFVVTSKVGTKWDRVDCLTWDELRAMQESGVFSIQSHSHDLHRKVKTRHGMIPVFVAAGLGLHDPPGGSSWQGMVCEDLKTSHALIKEHLGVEPRFLAWPYGFASAVLDSVAMSAGFEATCTLEEGTNSPQPFATTAPYRDRLELRRFTITARTTMKDFRLIFGEDFPAADAIAGTEDRGGFFGLLENGDLDGP